MKNQFSIFLLVLFLSTGLTTATPDNPYAVPKLERTARSAAVGENSAVLSGLNSVGVNPGAFTLSHQEVLAHYQELPLQTNVAMVGFGLPVSRLNTNLGVTYLGLRSTEFDRRNELGDLEGQFNSQDQIFGFHISRPLNFFLPLPINIGASFKILESRVDSISARGHAVDLGVKYDMVRYPFTLGISMVNWGQGPTLHEEESPLPTEILMAAAYQGWGPIKVLAGFGHALEEKEQTFSLGAEYSFKKHLALRGQYAFVQGGESKNLGFQNLAAGLGIGLIGNSSLDYSFQPFDTDLREAGEMGTHRVTMTLRLGGSK